jgi:uracil-DNA glycosylase family 4
VKSLPLYPELPQALAAWEIPIPFDPDCTRCELHGLGARTRCMRDGAERSNDPGGVYLIGEMPGREEDRMGRPFVGDSGRLLRSVVVRHWKGPLFFGNAVRCAPGRVEVKPKHVSACRVYTGAAIRACKPSRIVALGSKAMLSVLGRSPPVLSVRRGWGWWLDDEMYVADPTNPAAWVPVFFTMNPAAALRNRFLARQFESDIQWALTCEIPSSTHLREAGRIHVSTAEVGRAAVEKLRAAEWATVDTETSGVMFNRDFQIDCITLTPKGSIVGFTWDRAEILNETTRVPLLELLNTVPIIGHNLKYDMLAIWCEPLLHLDVSSRMRLDTRLMRKLRDGGDADGKLETMAELVGMGGHKEEAHNLLDEIEHDLVKLASEPHRPPLPSGKPRKPYTPKVIKREVVSPDVLERIHNGTAEPIQYAYRYMNPAIRARYNARDVLATAVLAETLAPEVLGRQDFALAWNAVGLPASRALMRIERTGILADEYAIDAFDRALEHELVGIRARLKHYGDINYDSPDQLAELLFKTLKQKPVKTTSSGRASTDREVLDELAARPNAHPIVKDILEFRHLRKLQGTYARGLRYAIKDDGRIHTTYLVDGAGSGRLSAQDPNLQNQPSPERDKVYGKMARDCFCSRDGYLLLEADYSQLELRVAAMISQDPVMIRMFESGHDFHLQTAKLVAPKVWGVKDWDALTDEQKKHYRRDAKTLNFTINYDHDPTYTVANKLSIPVADAEVLVRAVMGEFRVLKRTIEKFIGLAMKHGGVPVYIDGKQANWRPLIAIADQGDDAKGRVKNAVNSAWNTPVQGTAAHFATRSLEPIQKCFDAAGLDAELVLTVHDSIMVEVRKGQERKAAEIMHEVMTGWHNYGVPVVVDFKLGDHWGSMHEYKLAA